MVGKHLWKERARIKKLLTVVWLSVIAASAVGQGTLMWDEAIDGEFDDSRLFVLTNSGAFIFRGNVWAAPNPNGSGTVVDADYIQFDTAGRAINSLSLVVTNGGSILINLIAGTTLAAVIYTNGSYNLLGQLGVGTLDPGSYTIFTSGWGLAYGQPAGWEWTIGTTSVPEPSALALFVIGLGCLSVRYAFKRFRRRKYGR